MSSEKKEFCPNCGAVLNNQTVCDNCGNEIQQIMPVDSSPTEKIARDETIENKSAEKEASIKITFPKNEEKKKFCLHSIIKLETISPLIVALLVTGYVFLFYDLLDLFFSLINASIVFFAALFAKTFLLIWLLRLLLQILGLVLGILLMIQPFKNRLDKKLKNKTLKDYFIWKNIKDFKIPRLFIFSSLLLFLNMQGIGWSAIIFVVVSTLVMFVYKDKNDVQIETDPKVWNSWIPIVKIITGIQFILLVVTLSRRIYSILWASMTLILNRWTGWAFWGTTIWNIIYVFIIVLILFIYMIPYIYTRIQNGDWEGITDQKLYLGKIWIPIPLFLLSIMYTFDFIGWEFRLLVFVLAFVYMLDILNFVPKTLENQQNLPNEQI